GRAGWSARPGSGRARSCLVRLPGRRGYAGETLLQVPDEVVGVLQAHRQAHRARPDAGRAQLVVAQLAVRGAARVDDQALRVADVRQVRPERQTGDEILPAGPAPGAVEGEHRPGAARQVLL